MYGERAWRLNVHSGQREPFARSDHILWSHRQGERCHWGKLSTGNGAEPEPSGLAFLPMERSAAQPATLRLCDLQGKRSKFNGRRGLSDPPQCGPDDSQFLSLGSPGVWLAGVHYARFGGAAGVQDFFGVNRDWLP